MRALFITAVFLLFIITASAQAPQGIPYQAVARNSSGAIIASHAVGLRFTIKDSTITGSIVYQETFSITTNSLGLFNINIGTGTAVSGTFSGINWGHNAKFMQVEMDTSGGTTYTDMGTQQMMSVPFALYSNSAGSLNTTGSNSNTLLYTSDGF